MEKYRTKDIYEASALLASDVLIIELERESSFYWFVFENATACRTISNAYWANTLMLKAKDYADAVRSLKDRIFAGR